MTDVVIVGAGLSGLAAAIRLTEAGHKVRLFDQADHARGRCRSYHDSVLDRRIDNGNDMMLRTRSEEQTSDLQLTCRIIFRSLLEENRL